MPIRHHRLPKKNPLGTIFLLIILLALGALGVRFLPFLFSNNFGRFERFNLAIFANQPGLLSVDTKDKSAVLVIFPNDLYVPLVHGYGNYKISESFNVGNLDKRGGEVFQDSMQEYLGVPIDGYVRTSGNLTNVKGLFQSPSMILGGQTSLNPLEMLQFSLALQNIRFDQIKTINLSRTASPLVLADGSQVKSIETENLDNFLQGDFFENNIRAENLRVEIVNSTDRDGLGNQAARLIGSLGTSVIGVSSAPIPLTTCQVQTTSKSQNSLTVGRIIKTFSCQLNLNKTPGRSDVKVILGQDYVNKLTK